MNDWDAQYIHHTILQSIADGVFTVDRDWRIRSFNRAAEKITGVPAQEAIGQPCCEVFRSSICEGECSLRETMRTGEPIVNRAIYIIDATGNRIPVTISTAILKDESGGIMGGVETFRDLTQVEALQKELKARYTFEDMIGRSRAMQDLFTLMAQVAESDSTVLIQGDSGTGKELVARAIHHLSPRREGPFVALNCGALPDTLLESELFGYKAGAFTDARQDKPGRFELANGGALFLDEIGDISTAMQVRLLRVLQERVVEPLGAVESLKVDVRVIAATNKALEEQVEQGTFREDLYYRIQVIHLDIPPLRERREDIPLLADHFIERFNQLQNKEVTGLSPGVLASFMDYDFPGNVRELENMIEHAFALCSSGAIQLAQLPRRFQARHTPDKLMLEGGSLQAMEKAHIIATLKRLKGNRSRTAQELGINPSTLYRKIKRLGIEAPEETPSK